MTVAELGKRMSGEELIEWMVFDRLHPIPDPWLQTGVMCQYIAEPWLKKKSGGKWRPTDFMPVERIQRHVQSEEECKAAFDAVTSSLSKR
ncbi:MULTISPECIES: hypothetical protein [Pirellulaceae]|nr:MULTISPECIES: hypothetical protein [Pirellulaceae]